MSNKEHILRFRAVNKDVFDAIRNGKKKVETRAWTKHYASVKEGDTLVFKCDKSQFKKRVKSTRTFRSVEALVRKYRPKDINPSTNTLGELKSTYMTYPNYEEKIRRYGLIAWEL